MSSWLKGVKFLSGVPALVLCAATPATWLWAAGSDEALRRDFAARQMLEPLDKARGSARALAHNLSLAQVTYSVREPLLATCISGVEVLDTPGTVTPGAINAFPVSFKDADAAICQTFAAPELCSAVKNNCLAVGDSIFCDVSAMQRFRNHGRLTYWANYVTGAFAEKELGLPAVPLTAIPVSTLKAMLSQQIEGTLPLIQEMELPAEVGQGEKLDLQNTNVAAESLEFILIGIVAAHELVHVQQNRCAGALQELSGTFIEQLDLYYEFTCAPRLNRNEVLADLVGIRGGKHIVWHQNALISLGYGQYEGYVPGALKEMDIIEAMQLMAIANALEYETLFGSDPEANSELLFGEPDDWVPDQTIQAYLAAGVASVLESAEGNRFSAHMDHAFRVLYLLEQIDFRQLFRLKENARIHSAVVGIRLFPYVIGRLGALRHRDCGIDLKSAISEAEQLLYQRLGPVFTLME